MQTLTIDTTTGKNLYQTECGRGDGKEQVVRLVLTQPMALGIDCTETGSHVFELARQLNPLDACNANAATAPIPRRCRSAARSRSPTCSRGPTT